MIDTVVLILSQNEQMFHIRDPDKFEPSAAFILNDAAPLGRYGYISAKQNPTKKDQLEGNYKPRLTLTKRINRTGEFDVSLKVELSLPKLYFGNNFEELTKEDLIPIMKKLEQKLEEMGIITTAYTLAAQALLSAVHFSKNITLIDGSTPYHYINKIREANVTRSLDVNQTDFRNEGHSFKWHCNSYEVTFYDKIKDLEMAKRSDKRAIEDDNSMQQNIAAILREQGKFEVLRMEVRINNRQKLKPLLAQFGMVEEVTLKAIFDGNISQSILLDYFDKIEQGRPALLDHKTSDLLASLVVHNPGMSILKLFAIYGLKKAAEDNGLRELRTIFTGNTRSNSSKNRSWQRLLSDAKNISLPLMESPFVEIRKQLKEFKPLRLKNFKKHQLRCN